MSKYIRQRDPYCVTCGNPTTEAGHYIPNGERNQSLDGNELWYDDRNVHGQCAGCNRLGNRQLMMERYARYLEDTYGNGILQFLRKTRDTLKRWTRDELERVRDRFISETR